MDAREAERFDAVADGLHPLKRVDTHPSEEPIGVRFEQRRDQIYMVAQLLPTDAIGNPVGDDARHVDAAFVHHLEKELGAPPAHRTIHLEVPVTTESGSNDRVG